MEQSLIEEGLPESEVKHLCDVHVEVFKQSLDEKEAPQTTPGHPVHTFMMENMASEKVMNDIASVIDKIGEQAEITISKDQKDELKDLIDKLSEINKHYLRKENQLFPILESHGVSGPSQVMWAIHDNIRAAIKNAKKLIAQDKSSETVTTIRKLLQMIKDINYKEKHILYPMSLETLTQDDWIKVKRGEEEIGYAWIKPGKEWVSEKEVAGVTMPETEKIEKDKFVLDSGNLSLEQINLILTHLPVELSFVDENDGVTYYSATKQRIFPRSPGVIGRKVQKCHLPKSVHIVNKILEEFKKGKRDVAEFWMQKGDRFFHIRYYAVRDSNGNYKGTLEVTQDVTEIRRLEGEKRLLDWE